MAEKGKQHPSAVSKGALRAQLLGIGGAQSMVGVRLGAGALLGIESSLDAVKMELQRYTLFDVLATIGRISAILNLSEESNERRQRSILYGLFNAKDAGRILVAVEREMRRDRRAGAPRPFPVLFDEHLLVTLALIAGATLPADATEAGSTGLQLDGIGRAALILNDLLHESDPLDPTGVSFDTADGQRRWAYYFAVSAGRKGGGPPVNWIVRAADMFLADHPALSSHPCYVDFRALFQKASGITVEEYAFLLIVFLGRMYGVKIETVATTGTVVTFDDCALAERLDKDKLRNFFAFCGSPVADFCARARAAVDLNALNPHLQLEAERSPMVLFDRGAVCHSVGLLEDTFSSGLYYRLRDAIPERPERERYMEFVGAAFESTVQSTLERWIAILRAQNRRWHSQARIVTEREILAALTTAGVRETKCADFLLVLGRDVIAIETKAKFFSVAARTGVDEEAYFKRLDEIVVRGGQQLDATIQHLRSGSLATIGLAPGHIRRVLPVVLSFSDLFVSPPFREYFDQRLADEGALNVAGDGRCHVRPLEVLDCTDFEALEAGIERLGQSPVEQLLAKQRDPLYSGTSFNSWSAYRRRFAGTGQDRHTTYHAARYEKLGAAAESVWRQVTAPELGGQGE